MFDDRPIFEFRGPLGVPVQIGGSLIFLLLIFVNFSSGPEALFYSLIYFGLVVGSIFLHEMGHAWGAWIQGVAVRRVMIYGGGGFCEHAPASRYEDELIVAMGPITNVVIWAVASLAAPYIESPEVWWVVSSLADLNLFLAIFNMIPVFPLDGGASSI
jgi:Zn-dependent protease